MKKILLSVFFAVIVFSTAFAQVPASFNYQAVVRNSSGEILANKTVSFRISLLKNSKTGAVVYSEKHKITTNDFGLVNLKIGKGTKISGNFSPANWGEVIFTKIEIDPAGGSSFSELVTSKLSSVPYAFKAQTVVNDKVDDADHDPTNEIQKLKLTGTLLELSKGGGSVTLPTSGGGGGDNWGAQTVKTDATLTGNGTSGSPLSVVADGDGDDTNEIQTLSLSGNDLTIEGGNTVTLPESNSPWHNYPSDGIYYMDGPVGIGTSARYTSNLFSVDAADKTAIYAHNHSANKAALYSGNSGTGLAAFFDGTIKIKDGNQGTGKVLTSDYNGIASWQTPASSGSSLWTASGSNIYRNSGKVGIGTTSPTYNVDIEGSLPVLRLSATSTNAVVVINRKQSTNYACTQYETSSTINFLTGLLQDNDYWINYGYPNSFKGLKVKTTGDVVMSKDLKVAGEVHSENTGNANMIPIAYGTIKNDGTIYKSSGNISVSKTATGTYHITITGESYIFYNYITTATLTDNGFITTGSVSGKLIINTSDTSGNPKNMIFSFVVYKP